MTSAMQSAADLLSRPLPILQQQGGTTHASVHSERLSGNHMYEWVGFREQATEILQQFDFSGMVSITDSLEGEKYVVANKLGLTARFIQNVCEPINKALSVAGFPSLRFGDVQAVAASDPLFPDAVMLQINSLGQGNLLAVGELKTYWTLRLENMPVTGPSTWKRQLEHPIGIYQSKV